MAKIKKTLFMSKKNNVICSDCMKPIEHAEDMRTVYNKEKGWNEIVHSRCPKVG
jgi:hypothetical protein